MDDKGMEENEILDMAGFKLEEAARRLMSLACECTSPVTRDRLRALADLLLHQHRLLRGRGQGGESAEVRQLRPAPGEPGPRPKRRAVG